MADDLDDLISRITPANLHPEAADFAPDPLGANVQLFPGVSPNSYDPNVMLAAAMRGSLTEVVIVGWDADGDLFFSSSVADGADCLWLLEKAKLALLKVGE